MEEEATALLHSAVELMAPHSPPTLIRPAPKEPTEGGSDGEGDGSPFTPKCHS